MTTQTNINIQPKKNLPSPVIALLLRQDSASSDPPESSDVVMEQIHARATIITVALKEILEQTGYHHGGLNE